MKHSIRAALLAGAVLVAGAGAAFAQMEPPPPPPDMYGPGPMHGRMATRLLKDFDLNHDGQITKDEMQKAEAQRFAKISGGAATISEAQLAGSHDQMFRQHTEDMFHRIDWNGDGVLSLAEFAAPIRARFEMMDRKGTGEISCATGRPQGAMRDKRAGGGMEHGHGMHRFGGHFHHHFKNVCKEADLNHDGKVTRAEADKMIAQKYDSVVKGGRGMTLGEFTELAKGRFDKMEARRFKRLDRNHDGKLSEAEFAAPGEKMFARLDRNHDGVLTKDELTFRPHHGPHHRGWDRKPG